MAPDRQRIRHVSEFSGVRPIIFDRHGGGSMKVFAVAAATLALMSGLAMAETTPAAKAAVAKPATAVLKAAKPKAAKPAAKTTPAVEAEAPAAPVILEPLANSLQTYAAFQQNIDLVNGGSIQNAKDIERALDKAAAINRDQLTRGYIAYGALTAARNERFVAEVRKIAASYGKERVMKALANNYTYAGTIPGGAEATDYIVRAAATDSDRVKQAGERLKTRAREAQKLKWGTALSGPTGPRMSRIKAAATEAPAAALSAEMNDKLKIVPGSGDPSANPVSFGGDSFWSALGGGAPTATLTALPQAKPIAWTTSSGGSAIRGAMLSLGAMYAIDATMDQPETTRALLNNNLTNSCLQRAQLQFYQCVASAHFNYENMACVGEAGLITVGNCFADATK
jgi:hypothetical protein